MSKPVTVVVSGGYDPVHVGHIRGFREASMRVGVPVTVVLNSDDWLIRKKGFRFMSWEDRAEILSTLKWVRDVSSVDDSDGTVVKALERLRPTYFYNGGDRTRANTPELEACERLGIEPIFSRHSKEGSSSAIAARAVVQRQWGTYELLAETPNFKVKRLVIRPGKATSVQRHKFRSEYWFHPNFLSPMFVPQGEWHQLENTTKEPLELIEVQVGLCEEEDIQRATPDQGT